MPLAVRLSPVVVMLGISVCAARSEHLSVARAFGSSSTTTRRVGAAAAAAAVALLPLAAATTVALAPATAATPSTALTTPAAYYTIQWGRTNWRATNKCQTVPDARTLEQNAQDLAARRIFAVGGVVIARTEQNTRPCINGITKQASWTDIARLRDTYGWRFVSQSMTYSDMTLLTTDGQRRAESTATLPILAAHGHPSAWGAFFYPNNKQDAAAQRVVTGSFAFGRVYSRTVNTRASATTYPYPMRTVDVSGGNCFNPALPCATRAVLNESPPTAPTTIAAALSPRPDEWGVVQFYRWVTGKVGTLGDRFAWDCTSPDWRNRWTSQVELYCRNSALAGIDARAAGGTVADPATVATAWGRVPRGRVP